jgi:hypothetical protein
MAVRVRSVVRRSKHGNWIGSRGRRGIDTVNGGPGDEDLVHGDYGWDRLDGGAGRGDIASFASAVAGRPGRGVWVSLRSHKARGDGHDRLFRFESVEGSAFADTLIGDKGVNRLDGGAGNDRLFGGGGRDTLDGSQGTDRCKGGYLRLSCGPEKPPGASAYVEVARAPGGGGASFAETQAHPGLLYISLARGAAWIDVTRGCHKVRLARSVENI